MIPNALILFLLTAFVVSNIAVEWLNRRQLSWKTEPLSSYLADVPYAWIQDTGYFMLAAVFFILSFTSRNGSVWILFLGTGVAVILVVLTKYYVDDPTHSISARQDAQHVHVICAGIAYICMTLALLIETWPLGGIARDAALAAPATAFLFYRFAPSQTALEEKAVTACLMVSLYAWVQHVS